jgi:hypothetical protein
MLIAFILTNTLTYTKFKYFAVYHYTQLYTEGESEMSNVISLGKKTQPRIFVEKDGVTYVTPYWISRKGNLCWKINDVVYVKRPNGFVMMLEEGLWIPADATTEATVGR